MRFNKPNNPIFRSIFTWLARYSLKRYLLKYLSGKVRIFIDLDTTIVYIAHILFAHRVSGKKNRTLWV